MCSWQAHALQKELEDERRLAEELRRAWEQEREERDRERGEYNELIEQHRVTENERDAALQAAEEHVRSAARDETAAAAARAEGAAADAARVEAFREQARTLQVALQEARSETRTVRAREEESVLALQTQVQALQRQACALEEATTNSVDAGRKALADKMQELEDAKNQVSDLQAELAAAAERADAEQQDLQRQLQQVRASADADAKDLSRRMEEERARLRECEEQLRQQQLQAKQSETARALAEDARSAAEGERNAAVEAVAAAEALQQHLQRQMDAISQKAAVDEKDLTEQVSLATTTLAQARSEALLERDAAMREADATKRQMMAEHRRADELENERDVAAALMGALQAKHGEGLSHMEELCSLLGEVLLRLVDAVGELLEADARRKVQLVEQRRLAVAVQGRAAEREQELLLLAEAAKAERSSIGGLRADLERDLDTMRDKVASLERHNRLLRAEASHNTLLRAALQRAFLFRCLSGWRCFVT